MAEEKAGEQPAAGEQTIDKAEFEKLKGEYEALKKSNEEMKLEFMGEDYLNFLEKKDATPAKEEKKADPAVSDDEFSKLTPKQIYEKALKDAEAKIESKLGEVEQKRKEEAKARTLDEIKEFASTHDDFEKYRNIMAALSSDPKFLNAGLEKLYKGAKDYVKSLAGASDEEKEKSRRSAGEKPGASSSSFKKGGGKLSADEAAEEAWDEVVGKSGLPI